MLEVLLTWPCSLAKSNENAHWTLLSGGSGLGAVAFVYPIRVFHNKGPRARRGRLGSSRTLRGASVP
jgi:hypothetical protein